MKPLEQYTVDELKVLAYDNMALAEQSQKNLQVINARIAELSKLPEVKEEKKK